MKHALAVAAAVFFLLLALPAAFPAAAASQTTSRLLVIDDTVKMLPASKPLIIIDDAILFPIDVFAEAFGVTYKVNQKDKTVTIFKGSSILQFMPDDRVRLFDGRTWAVGKSILNGSDVYVQASIVASDLGRIYTMLQDGIPRIKTRNAVFVDSDMNRIIQSRPLTEHPEVSSPSHYLCFIGLSANLSDQLTLLKSTAAEATFFLTRQELTDNPAAVLSILSAGQSVGFTTEAGFTAVNAGDYVTEYNRCNVLLNKIARMTTAQVILPHDSPDNTDSVRSAMLKKGYRLWKYNYDYSLNGLRVLPQIRWDSLIYVKGSVSATYLLDDLIIYMRKSTFGVKTASDATPSVFFNTVTPADE